MQGKIVSAYNRLYENFGRRNWWPTTLKGDDFPSYNGISPDNNGRFEIAVGAILTQNTSWNNVVKAIASLNKHSLLNPHKILEKDELTIKTAIRPSGYYNQKYKKLKNLSEWWIDNFDAVEISSQDEKYMTETRNSLLKINGIGNETADSIILYAFDMPTFVIDAYTTRIAVRHLGFKPNVTYDELRNIFMSALPCSAALFKEYHALFVELGKSFCKKSLCHENCPLITI